MLPNVMLASMDDIGKSRATDMAHMGPVEKIYRRFVELLAWHHF